MGRKKLNRTHEELVIQRRNRQKRFYQRHKARLNAARLKRYFADKWDIQDI